MDDKIIDANLKPFFQKLEATGIPLDEEKLVTLIRKLQRRLAGQKEAVNREVGFIVNLDSDDHWQRAIQGAQSGNLLLSQLLEARKLGHLVRRSQQIYDLAHGNHRVLGRRFGLYPRYGLDPERTIVTTGELGLDGLPAEVLGVIGCPGSVIVRATYAEIILDDLRRLSGDPWLAEATPMDLMKLGLINLFEDYRLGNLGAQLFAVAPYAVYLFAPEDRVDNVSAVCRECLERVFPDFTLRVDVTTERVLKKLG
jgi:hypothetical protein